MDYHSSSPAPPATGKRGWRKRKRNKNTEAYSPAAPSCEFESAFCGVSLDSVTEPIQIDHFAPARQSLANSECGLPEGNYDGKYTDAFFLLNDVASFLYLAKMHRIVGQSLHGKENATHISPEPPFLYSAEQVYLGLLKSFVIINPSPQKKHARSVACEPKQQQDLSTRDEAEEYVGESSENSIRGPHKAVEDTDRQRLRDKLLSVLKTDRALLYLDLWNRGYFVTSGSKFGCDFLIYRDLPSRCHSVATITLVDSHSPLPVLRLCTSSRIGQSVKKKNIFAFFDKSATLRYLCNTFVRLESASGQVHVGTHRSRTDSGRAPPEGVEMYVPT